MPARSLYDRESPLLRGDLTVRPPFWEGACDQRFSDFFPGEVLIPLRDGQFGCFAGPRIRVWLIHKDRFRNPSYLAGR
jgi:hypothetical protein